MLAIFAWALIKANEFKRSDSQSPRGHLHSQSRCSETLF